MTLYALGDLHLSPLIWHGAKNVTGDSRVLLDELASKLSGDDDLILCGDVFDTVDPPGFLLRMFREWVETVVSQGNRIHAYQGNHDKKMVSWPEILTSGVNYIGHGDTERIAGFRCAALDYAPKDIIARKLAELGTRELPDILFLHQAVRQYLDIDGAWNCDLDWVPEGIPTVVLGDIHVPWDQAWRPGSRAWYTGAGMVRSTSEVNPKSILQIEEAPPGPTITRVGIRSRAILVAQATRETLEETRRGARAWVQDFMAGNRPELAPASMLAPTIHLTFDETVTGAPALIKEAVADLCSNVAIVSNSVVTRNTVQGRPRIDAASALQDIPGIPAILERSGLVKTPAARDIVLDMIRPGKPAEIKERLNVLRADFFKTWDAGHAQA